VTNKEALDLALMTLERDNLKVGNIYVNYDIQKALIKLVKKELEKEEMMKRVMDGIPDMPIKVQSSPALPGGGIGRHPDIQARKEGDLIVADLPQVPRGSGGISKDAQPDEQIGITYEEANPPEPTIDGWPLYSGLPPIKVQDKSFEEFAQSFAQSAQVIGIPKKEWVELTDEETNALIQKWAGELVFEVTQALKEKNSA